ncbi:hypothetical protein, partial [Hallella sp.]|uniref:hypothetical protein n=1 Tax=Hallella sp. TaxID=2980186 RepID=UPI003080C58F
RSVSPNLSCLKSFTGQQYFFLYTACPFRFYDIHRVRVGLINEYDAITLNVIAHDIKISVKPGYS